MSKKRKIVNPDKRMRYIHPYDIWKTLMRLKVASKLAYDKPDTYFTEDEIAAALFANWHELGVRGKLNVIQSKIHYPLRCLKIMRRVEEEQVEIAERNWDGTWQKRDNETYRACPGLYSKSDCGLPTFAGQDKETLEQWEFDTIDEYWGTYIGRKGRKNWLTD
jgi:hypothetical protein